MSNVQTALSGYFEAAPYRGIVKDSYSTRDDRGRENRVEVAAWKVVEHEQDLQLKDENGNLLYTRILDLARGDLPHPGVDPLSADELARRTSLTSYADDQGGRSASTIRDYSRNPSRLRSLDSSHPIKRVLRRWARSQDLGHFEGGESTEQRPDDDAAPIDMDALGRAFKNARRIASENGLVFVDRSGVPRAEENNERIDYDEIRPEDRPLGDTKAAVLVEKHDGSTYEYWVDMENDDLVTADGTSLPPTGWS